MLFVARRGASLLRWAERVWPPRNEAQPNREGVASGSATRVLNETCSINQKRKTAGLKTSCHAKHATHLCCAARGHALAVWHPLALLSALRASPLGVQTRSAPRNIKFYLKIKNHHICSYCRTRSSIG